MNIRTYLIYVSIITLSLVNASNDDCSNQMDYLCAKCQEDKHYVARQEDSGDYHFLPECECEIGYVEVGNECVKKIENNCNEYDENGKCDYCDDDADLVNGKCVPKCTEGKSFDDYTEECINCPDGSSSCYKNDDDIIVRCKLGYGYNTKVNECKKCQDGCSLCIFYGNTEVCAECIISDKRKDPDSYLKKISNNEYSGYTMECPKLNSAKFLIASSLLVSLLLF